MNKEIATLDEQGGNELLLQAVAVIKAAILKSQARAAQAVNQEQLALYYGIGKYISIHSRKGKWGTGAIKSISQQLSYELPGLRGFSETSLKKMRQFYEQWQLLENRPPSAGELKTFDNENGWAEMFRRDQRRAETRPVGLFRGRASTRPEGAAG